MPTSQNYLTKFPEKYPYINKHGVSISKSEVDKVAATVLNDQRINTVTAVRFILWAMENTDENNNFVVFGKYIIYKHKCKAYWEKHGNIKTNDLSDDLSDGKDYGINEIDTLKKDYERLFNDIAPLDNLMKMGSSLKDRRLKRIRKKIDDMTEEERTNTAYDNLGNGWRIK